MHYRIIIVETGPAGFSSPKNFASKDFGGSSKSPSLVSDPQLIMR